MYFRNLETDEIDSISYLYELEKEDIGDSLRATTLFECVVKMIAYTQKGVSEHAFVFFTQDELRRIYNRCLAKRKED